jgi:shikimate kinase
MGMSGTGKSTVLHWLERRGYRVVDTDAGDWIEDRLLPDTGCIERHWREDRVDELIAEHELSDEPLFIAGTVINQGRIYPRFAEVVLLSVPLEVMIERVASPDTNPFGKTAQERDRIVADACEVEPLLRTSASLEIDTRRPLADVVDQLAALVGPPRSPADDGHLVRLLIGHQMSIGRRSARIAGGRYNSNPAQCSLDFETAAEGWRGVAYSAPQESRRPTFGRACPRGWFDAGRAGGVGMAFKAAAGHGTGGRSAGPAARSEPLIGLGD